MSKLLTLGPWQKHNGALPNLPEHRRLVVKASRGKPLLLPMRSICLDGVVAYRVVEASQSALPSIEVLRALQLIACAEAQAWQEECSRLTDLITQLEPP